MKGAIKRSIDAVQGLAFGGGESRFSDALITLTEEMKVAEARTIRVYVDALTDNFDFGTTYTGVLYKVDAGYAVGFLSSNGGNAVTLTQNGGAAFTFRCFAQMMVEQAGRRQAPLRTALGDAAHLIFDGFLQSAISSSSNEDVNITSSTVTLAAGTYLAIVYAYVHQSAGSGRLKFKYGSTSIESVISDSAAGETAGVYGLVMGTFTSDGTPQTAAIAINAGNASYTMTAKTYMQYRAIAIRI